MTQETVGCLSGHVRSPGGARAQEGACQDRERLPLGHAGDPWRAYGRRPQRKAIGPDQEAVPRLLDRVLFDPSRAAQKHRFRRCVATQSEIGSCVITVPAMVLSGHD